MHNKKVSVEAGLWLHPDGDSETRKRNIPGRILDLGNPLFITTLAQQHLSGGGMCQDMSADWFATICTSEECTCSGVTLDLVGLVHLC